MDEQPRDERVEIMLRPTGIIDPTIEIRPAGTQLDDLVAEALRRASRDERTLVTALTRRSAEQLAALLNEYGLRAAYMHAGTKPVDRIRVLRDLRSGDVQVLRRRRPYGARRSSSSSSSSSSLFLLVLLVALHTRPPPTFGRSSSASTFCARGSISPKFRSSLCSMPTRRASSARPRR